MIALFFVVLEPQATAALAEPLLGSGIGYTHQSYAELKLSQSLFSMPGGTNAAQPGLRLGYLTRARVWEMNLDLGLLREGGDFGSQTFLAVLPNVQFNLDAHAPTSAFVNAGVGLWHQDMHVYTYFSSADPWSSLLVANITRPYYGVGVGLQHFISAGHGLIRGEVRYEYVPKKEADHGATFYALDLVTVRAGFDLLIGK